MIHDLRRTNKRFWTYKTKKEHENYIVTCHAQGLELNDMIEIDTNDAVGVLRITQVITCRDHAGNFNNPEDSIKSFYIVRCEDVTNEEYEEEKLKMQPVS